MNKEYETHECQNMPIETVSIFTKSALTENPDDKQWVLYITRSATEDDLEENHYLETEGDIIWSTTVAIKNCPYCGTELQPRTPKNSKNSCYIQHIDSSSSYYSKVM